MGSAGCLGLSTSNNDRVALHRNEFGQEQQRNYYPGHRFWDDPKAHPREKNTSFHR
jgi:hypothetical protein